MNDTQTENKTSGLEIISFFLGEQVFSVNIMAVREIRGWAPATPLRRSSACARRRTAARG
jgi:purine-binding chemotaxis protein CheW